MANNLRRDQLLRKYKEEEADEDLLTLRLELQQVREPLSTDEVIERSRKGGKEMLRRLWQEDDGQDIAEYAVMLAVILVVVVGTVQLIGTTASNTFSSVASAMAP